MSKNNKRAEAIARGLNVSPISNASPSYQTATPSYYSSDVEYITVTLDKLRPYEHNPRRTPNPNFKMIKESIRRRGLDHKPNITRRPGEVFYIRVAGRVFVVIGMVTVLLPPGRPHPPSSGQPRSERTCRACCTRPWLVSHSAKETFWSSCHPVCWAFASAGSARCPDRISPSWAAAQASARARWASSAVSSTPW